MSDKAPTDVTAPDATAAPAPDENTTGQLTRGERRLGAIVLSLLLGVLVYTGYTLNRTQQQNAFDTEAGILAHEFERAVEELSALLGALAIRSGMEPGIDDLSTALRSQPLVVTSVGRYASIDGTERVAFENTHTESGLYDFRITELDDTGLTHPRAPARTHHPITRLEPMDPARLRLIGADLDTVDGLSEALARIEAINDELVTTLPTNWPGADQLFLFRPSYRGILPPRSLTERLQQSDGGYWFAVDPTALLATLGEYRERFDVTLSVSDTTGSSRPLVSHLAGGRTGYSLIDLYPRRNLQRDRTFGRGEITLLIAGDLGVPSALLAVFTVIALLIVLSTALIARSMRNDRSARLERRRTKRHLDAERARADRTLNAIEDAVFALDPAHRVRHLNPAAARLAGDTRTDMLDRRLDEVLSLRHEASGLPVNLADTLDGATGEGARDIDVTLVTAPPSTAVPGERRDPILRLTMSRTDDADEQASGYILVLRDISDERRLTRRLEYQANHDALTGCTNRRWFEQRLDELLDDMSTSGRRHALCYLDLDQFKVVNDTAGHAAGDRLLQELTDKLQSCCRDGDVLSRLGGDEFGLLLVDADPETARQAAGRLYTFFQSYIFRHGEDAFAVRASIGLVPLDEHCGTTGDVLAAADLACYAAKEGGRNGLYVYAPDDEAMAQRSKELSRLPELQRALAGDRFALHVQAVAKLGDAPPEPGVTHFEFLLRLTGEDGKPLTPSRIIQAAERNGLMRDIDRWVISHALASVAAIDDGPGRACSFSINLSGQSAADPSLIDFIEHEYARLAIEPSRIWFELTETAAISQFSTAVELTNRIRALGSRVALDDFGSGLSSFGYLKNLPVDVLKIDGQFVRNLVHDPIDRTMVRAIDEVGKSMGILTVAEFVEDQAIVEELRHIGIDYAQGYHIGRPQPLDEALAVLATAPSSAA